VLKKGCLTVKGSLKYIFNPIRFLVWLGGGCIDWTTVVLSGYQSAADPGKLELISVMTWGVMGIIFHFLIGHFIDKWLESKAKITEPVLRVIFDIPIILYLIAALRINVLYLPAFASALSIIVNLIILAVAILLALLLLRLSKNLKPNDLSRFLASAYLILVLPTFFLMLTSIRYHNPSDKPDIIVITLDTVRADHLGCYGYERNTSPALDEFASENNLFEQCRTPMPLTGPAHASLFSGEMPQVHNVLSNISPYPDGPDIISIAEELSKAGYITAGFPAAVHLGRDFNFDRGFGTYNESTVISGPAFLQGCFQLTPFAIMSRLGIFKQTFLARDSREVNTAFRYWYENFDINADAPIFAWLHYFDAHSPYQPPDNYWQEYDPGYSGQADGSQDQCDIINGQLDSTNMGESLPDGWSGADINNLVARYDGEIRLQDESLADLFNFLRENEVWDNAVIIIVSDHGEGMYDDGYFGHNFTLKDYETRLACVIKGPDITANIDTPLSMTDLTDYIEFVSGVEKSPGRISGGNLENDDPFVSMVFLKAHSWLDWPYKLTRTQQEEGRGIFYELYNLETDPLERLNFFETGSDVNESMTHGLDSWIEANDADFRTMLERENVLDTIDPSTREMLRSLGYIY